MNNWRQKAINAVTRGYQQNYIQAEKKRNIWWGISERLEKKKKVAFEISSLSNCPLSCKQEKHLTTPNPPPNKPEHRDNHQSGVMTNFPLQYIFKMVISFTLNSNEGHTQNLHASKDMPSTYDILATCFLINNLPDMFSYRANNVMWR